MAKENQQPALDAANCRRSLCPIAFGLDVFGDRWTLLVVRDLIFSGKRRYGEFLASDESISTNILADRLQRLETEGIITRSPDPEHGKRVIYNLTDKGKALLPVLIEIVRWSGKYDPDTGAPAEFLHRIEKDRDAVIRELLAGLNN